MRTAVVVVGAALAPGAWAVDSPVLDMTQQPTSVGWNTFFAGGGSAMVAGNALLIDSPINGFAGYGAPASLWPAASSDPLGWRIEARVNLTSRSINNSASGCLMLVMGDGAYKHFFELYPDHIALTQFAYTGTSSAPVAVEGQSHTYVLTGLGPNISVSVDGLPVLSATVQSAATGFNTFQFGDLLFANESHSSWTYVAFGAIPAPGSAALLLAAVLAPTARRRR